MVMVKMVSTVLESFPIIFQFFYSMLAEKLNMSPDDAEKWIVNLIRNARLDAKIDSKLVCIKETFCFMQYAAFFPCSDMLSSSH